MKNNSKSLVSIVLPVFNEAEMLPLTVVELKKALDALQNSYRFEVIFVDDGSTDDTLKVLHSLKSLLPHKQIQFSRNFGHQAALLAGIHAAQGDAVITLDSDLQHPPSFIIKLLEKYKKGADLVFTKRQDDTSIPLFKKLTSSWFYSLLNFFSPTRIQPSGSDFRLISRAAVDALLQLPEKRVFLRGMVSWIGFQTVTLEFQAGRRLKGESKYSLLKMLRLAIFGISSFSAAPLYLSALMGLLFSIATVAYGVYVIYIRYIVGSAIAGWSSVVFVVLGIGSVLSFLLAILGIYVAALYDEVKQRPIYIIRK